jgi:hypothetical protein
MLIGALLTVLAMSHTDIGEVFRTLSIRDILIGVVASLPTFIISLFIAYRIKGSTEGLIASVPTKTVIEIANRATTNISNEFEQDVGHPVPEAVRQQTVDHITSALSASINAAYAQGISGDNFTLAEQYRRNEELINDKDRNKVWLAVAEDVAKNRIYGKINVNQAPATSFGIGNFRNSK